MRRSVAAVVAVFALVLVGGCSSSGGSDSSGGETSSASVAVEDWADDFCGSFATWLDTIQTSSAEVGADIVPGDVASGRDAVAGLFADASAATQTLISDMEAAGAPDIDDGQGLVDQLVARFEAFDEAARSAQAEAEQIPVDDPAAFQTAIDDLTATFEDEVTKVGESFAVIDEQYPDQDLQQALSTSCEL